MCLLGLERRPGEWTQNFQIPVLARGGVHIIFGTVSPVSVLEGREVQK